MRTRLLPLLLPLLTSSGVLCATGRCYFPDGSLDTLSYACNTTAVARGEASTCCRAGDECYDSGTCFQGWSGITYRQSCTDATWKSDPACPQICLGAGQLGDGVWIQSCDLNTRSACCLGSGTCCDDSTALFAYAPGVLVAVLGNPGGLDRLGGEAATTASSGSVSSVSASSLSSSTSSPAQLSSSSSSSSGTSGAALSFSSSSSSSENSSSTVAIITGTVLGAAFALAFAGMLYFRRKYHSERKQRSAIATPGAQIVPYYGSSGVAIEAPDKLAASTDQYYNPAHLNSAGTKQFAELHGGSVRNGHELDSTTRVWRSYLSWGAVGSSSYCPT